MKEFMELLHGEDLPLTLEALSPRGGNVEEYLDKIGGYDFLEELIGVNVCNNPVGRIHIDPAPFADRILSRFDIEPIPHLTCRDSTLSGLQSWLLGADSLGLRTLLTMTGDYGKGDYPTEEEVNHINSLELITGIKDYLNQGKLMPEISTQQSRKRNRYLQEPQELEKPTDFNVGGVLIPNRPKEASYAVKKIEAGVDFFQTQINYDPNVVLDVLEKIEEETDNCPPVLVSFAPLDSKEEVLFLKNDIPQVGLPEDLQHRLIGSEDTGEELLEFAGEFFTSLKQGANERGLKTKIGGHIIPMMSEGLVPDLVRRIRSV